MGQKYRVGVVGHTKRGDYGHGLDTVWLKIPQTEIVAVADADPEGLAKAADRLKTNQAFSDYRKMLDEVKPQIVAVCPRWVDQHHEIALECASRGIHMYMEKPFCRTLKEADEIIKACEQSHTKLALAHITRYSPTLPTLERLLKEGAIGEVLEFRARGKEDSRGGGLDLWVLGSHVLDLMRVFGGLPEWCFATVTQMGQPVTKQEVMNGAEGIGPLAGDAVHAMYQLPQGRMGYFASQKNMMSTTPHRRFALQIYGSKGVIDIIEGTLPSVSYLADPSWCPGRSGAKWEPITSAGIGKPEPLTGEQYQDRNILPALDLIDAIEKHREPLCNMYEGRDIIEMIAGVFESYRQGKPVPLPLQTRVNPLTLLE